MGSQTHPIPHVGKIKKHRRQQEQDQEIDRKGAGAPPKPSPPDSRGVKFLDLVQPIDPIDLMVQLETEIRVALRLFLEAQIPLLLGQGNLGILRLGLPLARTQDRPALGTPFGFIDEIRLTFGAFHGQERLQRLC